MSDEICVMGESVGTHDVRLASALLAMGIYPSGMGAAAKIIVPGKKPVREIMLEGMSRCGRYDTRELIKAWRQGLEWVKENTEHPFAYVMAAMMNHRDMIAGLKQEKEYAFLKKGKSVAMLPMDASAQLEEEVLGKF